MVCGSSVCLEVRCVGEGVVLVRNVSISPFMIGIVDKLTVTSVTGVEVVSIG